MTHDAEGVAAAAAAVTNSAVAEQVAIETETLDGISATGKLMLMLAAGGLVLGLAAAWLIGTGVSGPVQRITEAMHRLASGELETDIPARDRTDEVGKMAQAMLVFRQNAQEARRLQGEAERVRAAKDRRQAAMDRHTQEFGTSVSGVMATLVSSADAMRSTADKMSDAAASYARYRRSGPQKVRKGQRAVSAWLPPRPKSCRPRSAKSASRSRARRWRHGMRWNAHR